VTAGQPTTVSVRPWPAKLVRYAAVSVVATATSLVTLGLLVGFSATSSTAANVIATAIGTVPSFELNRRWVWSEHGRSSLLTQVIPFCGLSLAGLALSTAAVHSVAAASASWAHDRRVIAVELANVSAYGALWVLQFLVLDRVLFARRRRGAPGPQGAAPAATVRSSTGSGRRTVNTVPPAGLAETETTPPWAATMAPTIERPSPLPPLARDLEGSAR